MGILLKAALGKDTEEGAWDFSELVLNQSSQITIIITKYLEDDGDDDIYTGKPVMYAALPADKAINANL